MVAIVGPRAPARPPCSSCCSASTIPRRPILLDGVDIKTADPAELRRRISERAAGPGDFRRRFADNIRYGGRRPATRRSATRRRRRAAADDFIRALPEGYDTKVGERGVTLSGGERQRSPSPAPILRDAPVLLLDEATSALDAANEVLGPGRAEKAEGRRAPRSSSPIASRRSLGRPYPGSRGGPRRRRRRPSQLVAQDGLYARLARLQFETGARALNGNHEAAAE